MLPFLPALLLLLIQGPASIDRLAQAGRLPEGLVGLQRSMVAGDPRAAEIAFDSLRQMASDEDIVQALQWIYARIDAEAPVRVDPADFPVCSEFKPAEPFEVPDGHSSDNRSRDGPVCG